MPTFDTPEPIAVTLELGVADIRIAAGDRTETVVEVHPSDAAKHADVTAAEQTRVEYADGRLLVKAPKGWRRYAPRRGAESIDLRIELPAGSRVDAQAAVAALRATGRLGDCRFRTGVGDMRIDHAGPVSLKTGAGDIDLERAVDHAELTTGSGAVRVGGVDGDAVIRNSNGDTWVGAIAGDLRTKAANGKISVDHANAGVEVKTANGDVRVGEVAHGEVLVQTAFGNLDVGVRDGVAAWLDLDTRHGNVLNHLDASGAPELGEDTVEVRARTAFGDITVRRCAASVAAGEEA